MAENSGVMKTLMTQRAQEIAAKIAALQSRSKIRIGFAPSSETDFIRYFPSDLHCILATNADDRFEVVTEGDPSAVDVLIITAHGANLANAIWGLRAQRGGLYSCGVVLGQPHCAFEQHADGFGR